MQHAFTRKLQAFPLPLVFRFLGQPFESDLLFFVLSFTAFIDIFKMPFVG